MHDQNALGFPERSASFQCSSIDSPTNFPIQYFEGIHKCPLEVLTEIFIDCLEDRAYICQIDRLLFVCRQWYLLIIHTPLFWTRITISISRPIRSVAAPRLCFVETFIQRSKGMLLDIEVECNKVGFTYDNDEWQNYCPAFDELCDNIYRFRTLHVTLPRDMNLSDIVCGLFTGPAPNMIKLSVGNFADRPYQQVAFSKLPNLRILEIDGYPFQEMVRHSPCTFPLAQLHSLDLNLYGSEIWARFNGINTWPSDVSLLRCLRSLQIRYEPDRTSLPHPKDSIREPISLPLLESLGLWGLDQLELRFELPALRSLSFDGRHFPKTDPIEVIWRPTWKTSGYYGEKAILRSIILQSQSIKLFVFPVWAKMDMFLEFREMIREGSIPESRTSLMTRLSFMTESMAGSREPWTPPIFDLWPSIQCSQ
jgi:hypothetical protein